MVGGLHHGRTCIFDLSQLIGKPLFMAQDEGGQLSSIFSILGLPTTEEWPDMEMLPEWEKIDLNLERNDEDFEFLLNRCTGSCLDLLMRMLSCNPVNRISAWEALHHEWFREDYEDDQ